MAIGYSINNFYNAATTYGLARNNAFRINNITGIDSILNSANTELLIFAKEQHTLKQGLRLLTNNVKYFFK